VCLVFGRRLALVGYPIQIVVVAADRCIGRPNTVLCAHVSLLAYRLNAHSVKACSQHIS